MRGAIGDGSVIPHSSQTGVATYRVSWVYRGIGTGVAVFVPVLDVLAARQNADSWSRSSLAGHIFSLMMIVWGIWIAAGVVRTDDQRVTKTFLWRSRSLKWSDVTKIKFLRRDIGAIELRADDRKLVIDSRFSPFQRLIDEVTDRTGLQLS